MELIVTGFLAPIVVGIILLYLEHRTKWFANFSSKMIRKTPLAHAGLSWSEAEDKAIDSFKAKNSQYDWQFYESITTESLAPEKGRKVLILTVQTTSLSKGASSRKPRVLEKRQLVIDRTGDVIEDKALPVQIDNSMSHDDEWGMKSTDFDNLFKNFLVSAVSSNLTPTQEIPETKIVLKKVEEPSITEMGTKVKVTISFTLENSGKPGKICPYIEFQAVVIHPDGSFKPKTIRSAPQEIVMDALTTATYNYTVKLDKPAIPLVRPPHKVKVELFPYLQRSWP